MKGERKFEEEVLNGAGKEGIAGEARDLEIETNGDYSVMSWVLRDNETGKDVAFTLKVNDRTGKLAERLWVLKDGEKETVIRHENFEAEDGPPQDSIMEFKALEREMMERLKSSKKDRQ